MKDLAPIAKLTVFKEHVANQILFTPEGFNEKTIGEWVDLKGNLMVMDQFNEYYQCYRVLTMNKKDNSFRLLRFFKTSEKTHCSVDIESSDVFGILTYLVLQFNSKNFR